MRRHRSFSVQSASGLNFHIPRCSSRSTSCGVGARRRLLAADAGDPRVGAGQRALERRDLGVAAAVLGRRPRPSGLRRVDDLDRRTPKRSSKALPGLQRLREQDAGVDRDDARVAAPSAEQLVERAPTPPSGTSSRSARGSERVGARRHLAGRSRCPVGLVVAQTAHSPSPRMTSNGTSAVPVDEVVHRLEAELDRQREVLDLRPRSALVADAARRRR